MTRIQEIEALETGASAPARGPAEAAPTPVDAARHREEDPEAGSVLVSVLVPVTERPDRLVPLYREYAAALDELEASYEFLFLVEPQHRHLAAPLGELVEDDEPVRLLEVGQSVGEASLLKLGGSRARGSVLVILPAYRRIKAEALPELVTLIRDGSADLVAGRRWPRRDPWINRLQTRLFHGFLGSVAGRRIHDTGCGVRAMRREVLEEVPLYGNFSRFLPFLAMREGYRVEEVSCEQHPEDTKARVYGPDTYMRRLIDAMGIFFLLRFTHKPLRFFGLLGGVLSLAGVAVGGVLVLERLGGQGIADRPLFLLAVLLFTFGVQAIALGLVGELIVHLFIPGQRTYRLDESSVRELSS